MHTIQSLLPCYKDKTVINIFIKKSVTNPGEAHRRAEYLCFLLVGL